MLSKCCASKKHAMVLKILILSSNKARTHFIMSLCVLEENVLLPSGQNLIPIKK